MPNVYLTLYYLSLSSLFLSSKGPVARTTFLQFIRGNYIKFKTLDVNNYRSENAHARVYTKYIQYVWDNNVVQYSFLVRTNSWQHPARWRPEILYILKVDAHNINIITSARSQTKMSQNFVTLSLGRYYKTIMANSFHKLRQHIRPFYMHIYII